MPRMKMELGLGAIRSFRRMSYTPWHALAEFVDNSTQSYFAHTAALKRAYEREGTRLTVAIDYETRRGGYLRISDNAMGMSLGELRRALIIGEPPPPPRYRSQYGLGLKTAASWFGNEWSVDTKKLGERRRYRATVMVERIADGDPTVPVETVAADAGEHFTIIEIQRLNRPIHARTRGKIRDYLRSMYRKDLREGRLTLKFMQEELAWDEDFVFAEDPPGNRLRHPFDFKVGSRKVTGWAGVLARGSRAKAGFSILHANRVVKGWPDAWRPEAIYGQPGGSNDLVNQRLVGEIDLGAFAVSHTKDDILWLQDEEAEVENALRLEIADLIESARQLRRSATETPSQADAKRAAIVLQRSLTSTELQKHWAKTDAPATRERHKRVAAALKTATRRAPDFVASSKGIDFTGYLSSDLAPEDDYLLTDTQDGVLLFVINLRHPFVAGMSPEVLVRHLEHSAFEALAGWKSAQNGASDGVFTFFKDGLLRIASTKRR